MGADERGEPFLPREGGHAVGPAALNTEETERQRGGGWQAVCKCVSVQIINPNFQYQ